MSLPPSGTIKLSEVKAEFGKGNNLLDYLGEGGVTATPPLKLTDFYGTQAGIQLPTTPQHTWANRIIYQSQPTLGNGTFTQSNSGLQFKHRGIFFQAAGFNYGTNNRSNGVSSGSTGSDPYTLSMGGDIGDLGGFPHRPNMGLQYFKGDAGNSAFTSTTTGAATDAYSCNDCVGYGIYIPPENNPINEQGQYLGAIGVRYGNVSLSNYVPGTIGIACIAGFSHSPINLNGVLGQVGGISPYSRHYAAVGYFYFEIPADSTGAFNVPFPSNSLGSEMRGCFYSSTSSYPGGDARDDSDDAVSGPPIPATIPEEFQTGDEA